MKPERNGAKGCSSYLQTLLRRPAKERPFRRLRCRFNAAVVLWIFAARFPSSVSITRGAFNASERIFT